MCIRDRRNDEVIAVGTKAREIYEKGHEYIRSVRPLRDGVIADFDAAEKMIRGMIKQINKKSHSLFSPSLRMVVSVPSGSTEVEIRAVKDSSEHAGEMCIRDRSYSLGFYGVYCLVGSESV